MFFNRLKARLGRFVRTLWFYHRKKALSLLTVTTLGGGIFTTLGIPLFIIKFLTFLLGVILAVVPGAIPLALLLLALIGLIGWIRRQGRNLAKESPNLQKPPQESYILAFLDHRTGSTNQTIALCQHLAEKTKRSIFYFPVHYSLWAILPNSLLSNHLLGLTKICRKNFLALAAEKTSHNLWVVGAGRRLSPLLRWFKHQHPSCKTIQILKPAGICDDFDALLVPRHDRPIAGKNVICYSGGLHNLNETVLEQKTEALTQTSWAPVIRRLQKPLLGVLVGGDHKKGILSYTLCQELIALLEAFCTASQGYIWLTTSRRTPWEFAHMVKRSSLWDPNVFFLWNETEYPNPYPGFLSLCSALLVTGDSMNLCAEAASTKVPLFIFDPPLLCSPKHKRFHHELYRGGYARPAFELLKTPWRPQKSLKPWDDISQKLLDRLC